MAGYRIGRRELLAGAATAALLPGALAAQGNKTGVDASTWTPDYINKLAGRTVIMWSDPESVVP